MTTLHVHLDESGNFVFNPKGSRYYIFTAAWTYNPVPLAAQLSRLRFALIKSEQFREGVLGDLSSFHACDDPLPRRLSVVERMLLFQDWNFASLVVEKRYLNDTLYAPEKFYPKFLNMVLKFVLKGRVRPTTRRVMVYTDALPMKSKKEADVVSNSIKAACRLHRPNVQFTVMHHSAASNYWIQVADYCSWAMNRKWEHGDNTFYDLLRPRLAAAELALMSQGDGSAYY